MAEKRLTYEGDELVITYSVPRCIHAAECVNGLRAVFDPDRRPWIDPGQAPADRIAEVVMRCPSGALRFRRKDGGAGEPVPDANTITVDPDGPLYVRGDVEVTLPDGTAHPDTRVALCRCGASKHKPFCDNSHREVAFKDPARFREIQVKPTGDAADGALRVQPARNGPILVQGRFELVGAGETARGGQAALCRCGGSGNKPFCDGTHNKIGFTSA